MNGTDILDQLNFTPATIVIALERAAIARNLYLRQCRDQQVDVNVAVDHALMNHVLRMWDLAKVAGVDGDLIQAALNKGFDA